VTNPSPNDNPQLEPLTRVQVLAAMGVTAIVLLIISKAWLYFDSSSLLDIKFLPQDLLLGVGIGIGITLLSGVIYQLWPAYRKSADMYLALVLKPLHWPDLLWLGLLPGLSEELLFRGVMLPRHWPQLDWNFGLWGQLWRTAHERCAAVDLRCLGYDYWHHSGDWGGGNGQFAGAGGGSHCHQPRV
jgi:membrane protease YdiL (CAAX protease family)